MGTGIVSIALALDGWHSLSLALLALAALAWCVLALLALARLLRDRGRLGRELRAPAGLTLVAATGVLGARVSLLRWERPAAAALAAALCLWLLLVPAVLRHWRRPTIGISFVLTVATESLAALAAALAAGEREPWLELAALVLLGLGLVAYLWVVSSFDLRQLAVGSGDHWISGGALAIATLACAEADRSARLLPALRPLHPALDLLALALWSAAALWLVPLLASELRFPRLRYQPRRWSTVFPFGMYAACSFVTGSDTGIGVLTSFARVWTWAAVGVWVAVSVGALRRGLEIARAGDQPRAEGGY